MALTLQTLAVMVAVGLLCSLHSTTAQDPEEASRLSHNLSFILPVIAVFVILVIILVVIVFVVYRARYGYFCCMKPTLHYRVQHSPTDDSAETGSSVATSVPPTYNQPPQASTISPPDYHDALQDVLVTSGPSTDTTVPNEVVETTLAATEGEEQATLQDVDISDESISDDDRTPLNP